MGLDLQHVLSDEAHYGPFECVICQSLVDLEDALATTVCSHAFCKKCLQQWLTRHSTSSNAEDMYMNSNNNDAWEVIPKCPSCNHDLLYSHNVGNKSVVRGGSMMIGHHHVTVQPLKVCQPLAYRVLTRIQVKCSLQGGVDCKWTGDYGDLNDHLLSKTAHLCDHDDNHVQTRDSMEHVLQPQAGSTAEHNHEADLVFESMEIDESENANNDQQQTQQSQIKTDNAERLRILNKHLTLAKSYKEEGNTKFSAGHYRQACEMFSKAIEYLNDHQGETKCNTVGEVTLGNNVDVRELLSVLYLNRATANFNLSLYQDVVEDAGKAIQLNPLYTKAYVRQAHAYIQLGKLDEAYATLSNGVHNCDNNSVLKKELKNTEELIVDWTTVQALLEKREFASAKGKLGKILHKSAAVLFLLAAATADLGMGNIDSASRLTLQALKKDGMCANALRIRGDCFVYLGEFNSGFQLYKESLRLDPDNQTTRQAWKEHTRISKLIEEANAEKFKRNFAGALEIMNATIQSLTFLPAKAPLYAMLYTNRAELHLRLKQYDLALKDCALVIYNRYDHVDAWLIRFQALHGLERHSDVLNDVQELMESWGANDPRIQKAYEKADFEARKQQRPDFYKMLNVSPIASEREIKKAYRQKALELHPDRLVGDQYTDAQRKKAEQDFQLLGEGLEILTDDFKRKLYDEGYDVEAIKERVERAQRAAHMNGHHHHG